MFLKSLMNSLLPILRQHTLCRSMLKSLRPEISFINLLGLLLLLNSVISILPGLLHLQLLRLAD